MLSPPPHSGQIPDISRYFFDSRNVHRFLHSDYCLNNKECRNVEPQYRLRIAARQKTDTINSWLQRIAANHDYRSLLIAFDPICSKSEIHSAHNEHKSECFHPQ